MIENLLEICNIRYKEIKRERFKELAYTAPELLPNIESDQVKAVIEVFQYLINDKSKENIELKNEIEKLRGELKSFKNDIEDKYEKKKRILGFTGPM